MNFFDRTTDLHFQRLCGKAIESVQLAGNSCPYLAQNTDDAKKMNPQNALGMMLEVWPRVRREVRREFPSVGNRELSNETHARYDHFDWQALWEKSPWWETCEKEQLWMDPDRRCDSLGYWEGGTVENREGTKRSRANQWNVKNSC